jgi:N-acetylglucosamine-6-phosphate deacetylase
VTLTRVTGRCPATGEGLAVIIQAGKITSVTASTQAADTYLAPGLIDLQVNDLNDGELTPDRVTTLTERLFKEGITTFLPTLITASRASLLTALRAIAEAREENPQTARAIPFVHVEGPYISPEDGPRGAHPSEHVRPPDLAELEEWQEACGSLVGMITLSPVYGGVFDFIRAATRDGIHIAIGHTSATPEQISHAVDAGACLSTHLGNGAAAMLPRHPNFIWAQLADDRLTATFIADGFHLPRETLRAMLRAKGLDRAILVSDLTALGGMPPGIYDQAVGGSVALSQEGRLSVAGTPYLAGAALPLPFNIATAITYAGLSLADALRLATANPGDFAGGRGRLEPGATADLIQFEWRPGATRLGIRAVIASGDLVAGAIAT